jgi:hypothetical protein
MVYGKRNGNVVTIPTNLSTGQPIPISSYEEDFPPDAFPVAISYQEACAKYGKANLHLFSEVKPPKAIPPGVDATDEDVKAFVNENQDVTQVPVTVPLLQKPATAADPVNIPGFIDTKFIDDCTKRAIQNEIETYEIAEKYASGKKAKEIQVIIKALKDFMDRIEHGKNEKA